MSEVKTYEAEEFTFEFSPNGSPLTGVLAATCEAGTYTAEINLPKAGSRKIYANEASKLYGFDASMLKRALNEICTLRTEEVAAAKRAGQEEDEHPEAEPETLSEEAKALVSCPSVLARYVEDVARIRGVVRDRDALRLQSLVAFGWPSSNQADEKPMSSAALSSSSGTRPIS